MTTSAPRTLLLTDLPGDVHGLLFHALAADDPEDCCSFFLSCKVGGLVCGCVWVYVVEGVLRW